jgi:hypothetical protein
MICSMAKKEIDKDKLILVILSTLVNLPEPRLSSFSPSSSFSA